MSKGKPIGLIGGAFDPTHIGHVYVGLACIRALDLQEVRFIPAHIPPHKTALIAAPHHRLAMLERALRPHPQLTVSDIELKRGGVSYTIDTLIELRTADPEQSYCFIMGADAFATLPTWQNWQDLTDCAHLVIINRRQMRAIPWEQKLRLFYAARACLSPESLHQRPHGYVHKTGVLAPGASSSAARALLNRGEPAEHILPPDVCDYIRENGLYQ